MLVEDEADLAMIVADTLSQQGYKVTLASDGDEGLHKFFGDSFDIVIADVMMPKMDGFEMAKRIRSHNAAIPLLFLTAKSSIDDVERGFNIGANDYLRKPFELRELIVRVRCLLRQWGETDSEDIRYMIGGYVFNASTQRLQINDVGIPLSNIEARILEPLAANVGKTVDASVLMIAVWQRDDPSNRNSLHGYIHKLRRALRHDPTISILNQRGFGYMLTVNKVSMSYEVRS